MDMVPLIFDYFLLVAIATFLGVQTWILYKLLPEIKSIAGNVDVFKLFKPRGKGAV